MLLVIESAIQAFYPSGRIVAPKVRAMIDFLLDAFSPVPPWDSSKPAKGRMSLRIGSISHLF